MSWKFFCFCSALAASSSVLANSACDAADGKWSSCGTGFSRSSREVNVVIDSSSLVSRRLRSVLQEYTSRINSINRILAKTPAVIRQKIGDFKFTNLFLNSVFIRPANTFLATNKPVSTDLIENEYLPGTLRLCLFFLIHCGTNWDNCTQLTAFLSISLTSLTIPKSTRAV